MFSDFRYCSQLRALTIRDTGLLRAAVEHLARPVHFPNPLLILQRSELQRRQEELRALLMPLKHEDLVVGLADEHPWVGIPVEIRMTIY
jgi:hypothetical protein